MVTFSRLKSSTAMSPETKHQNVDRRKIRSVQDVSESSTQAMSPESAQNVSKVSTQFCQFACLSNQKRDQKRERTKVSETWHENVNQKWSVCSHRWQAASRAARRSATRRSALACDGGVFLSFSVYFEPFLRSNSASKQTSKRTTSAECRECAPIDIDQTTTPKRHHTQQGHVSHS